MSEQQQGEKKWKGLKRLRNFSEEKKPTYHCDNCKCDRFAPCTCKRKGDNF